MNKLLLFVACMLLSTWVTAQQNKPVPKAEKLKFTTTEETPPKRDSLLVSEPFEKDRILMDEQPEENYILNIVEQMPVFPGGYDALQKYISTNLHYPENALAKAIKGVVYLSFVVSVDGSIKDVSIAKGIDLDCDKEALRLIVAMPAWKPGRQNGRPVSIRYSFPVTFYPREKK